MKYSIVIPYRDRLEHLKILVEHLQMYFAYDPECYEIIVAEQANDDKFRRGNMRNEGARVASGDYIVFHDVDYVPCNVTEYSDDTSDVYLPVRRVEFVYNNLKPKPKAEIPGGYQHFKFGVDEDFFGGVLTFKRDAFFKIGGFNPKYVGWGFEDADLRERVKFAGLRMNRSLNNSFMALDHADSGPAESDADYRANITRFSSWWAEANIGLNNYHLPTVSEVGPELHGVTKWLKVTDIDPPPPATSKIVASSFTFDD